MLNNVDGVINGEKGREDMGGIWTSKAAKGKSGIGSFGNVAIDESGRKVHDDFVKLLLAAKQHRGYPGLEAAIKEKWSEKEAANPKKRRKTNVAAQSTVGPTFNLLGSEPGSGTQNEYVRQMLGI